ncbi:uncharacterized protein LOC120428627 [Culex pipiens pallens]|uniref:uncharacterized protein LOC120428627 n=1 Tax=Culex pipiens pallens TaxID=42434 RepID=UPI0022AA5D34|nr:uncharacterized protein LOC120428627 [Culex pipiens pallens]
MAEELVQLKSILLDFLAILERSAVCGPEVILTEQPEVKLGTQAVGDPGRPKLVSTMPQKKKANKSARIRIIPLDLGSVEAVESMHSEGSEFAQMRSAMVMRQLDEMRPVPGGGPFSQSTAEVLTALEPTQQVESLVPPEDPLVPSEEVLVTPADPLVEARRNDESKQAKAAAANRPPEPPQMDPLLDALTNRGPFYQSTAEVLTAQEPTQQVESLEPPEVPLVPSEDALVAPVDPLVEAQCNDEPKQAKAAAAKRPPEPPQMDPLLDALTNRGPFYQSTAEVLTAQEPTQQVESLEPPEVPLVPSEDALVAPVDPLVEAQDANQLDNDVADAPEDHQLFLLTPEQQEVIIISDDEDDDHQVNPKVCFWADLENVRRYTNITEYVASGLKQHYKNDPKKAERALADLEDVVLFYFMLNIDLFRRNQFPEGVVELTGRARQEREAVSQPVGPRMSLPTPAPQAAQTPEQQEVIIISDDEDDDHQVNPKVCFWADLENVRRYTNIDEHVASGLKQHFKNDPKKAERALADLEDVVLFYFMLNIDLFRRNQFPEGVVELTGRARQEREAVSQPVGPRMSLPTPAPQAAQTQAATVSATLPMQTPSAVSTTAALETPRQPLSAKLRQIAYEECPPSVPATPETPDDTMSIPDSANFQPEFNSTQNTSGGSTIGAAPGTPRPSPPLEIERDNAGDGEEVPMDNGPVVLEDTMSQSQIDLMELIDGLFREEPQPDATQLSQTSEKNGDGQRLSQNRQSMGFRSSQSPRVRSD